MLYWEWRRIFRQKLRSLIPRSTLSYQQWSRRRLLVSFVLFFAGWKAVGYTLNNMLLWTVDEVTGEGRFLSPKEGKERSVGVGGLLAHSISPILPHLAAQFWHHQPCREEKKIFRQSISLDESSLPYGMDPNLDDVISCILNLKRKAAEQAGPKTEMAKMGVALSLTPATVRLLESAIGPIPEVAFNSQLCELLRVSMVPVAGDSRQIDVITLVDGEGKHCERCRKNTRQDANQQHCRRCVEAIASLDLE